MAPVLNFLMMQYISEGSMAVGTGFGQLFRGMGETHIRLRVTNTDRSGRSSRRGCHFIRAIPVQT